jgi:hypothetical protein
MPREGIGRLMVIRKPSAKLVDDRGKVELRRLPGSTDRRHGRDRLDSLTQLRF